MIIWKYGQPVEVFLSDSYYHLRMRLLKVNKRGRIILIDKTGTLYYTHKDLVEFILPPYTIPQYDNRHLTKMMIVEEGDYFE